MVEGADDTSPSFLLIADDPAAVAQWEAAADVAGVERPRRVSLAANAPVEDAFSLRVVVLELPEHDSASAHALTTSVDDWATRTGGTAIVGFSRDAIDRVAAAVSGASTILLCEATQLDRIVALGAASTPGAGYVAEIDQTGNVLRLQQLADEVGRIARALAQANPSDLRPDRTAVSDAAIGYRPPPSDAHMEPAVAVIAPDIRAILRLRRQREAMFGTELFADPAWDMILDLAAARLEGVQVAVSSLCIAAAVPPTTALRWIRTLTDLGIFERRADSYDGRRVFIVLSEDAAAKVLDFLGRALAVALPI